MRPPAQNMHSPSSTMAFTTSSGISSKTTVFTSTADADFPLDKSVTIVDPTVDGGSKPYPRMNSRASLALVGFSRMIPRCTTTWSHVINNLRAPSPRSASFSRTAVAFALASARTKTSGSSNRIAFSSISGFSMTYSMFIPDKMARRVAEPEPKITAVDVSFNLSATVFAFIARAIASFRPHARVRTIHAHRRVQVVVARIRRVLRRASSSLRGAFTPSRLRTSTSPARSLARSPASLARRRAARVRSARSRRTASATRVPRARRPRASAATSHSRLPRPSPRARAPPVARARVIPRAARASPRSTPTGRSISRRTRRARRVCSTDSTETSDLRRVARVVSLAPRDSARSFEAHRSTSRRARRPRRRSRAGDPRASWRGSECRAPSQRDASTANRARRSTLRAR